MSLPLLVALFVLVGGVANADDPTPVGLGTATDFAVRGGDAVSDVPTSTITGDVGLSPAGGTSYTGLTCAEVTGTVYKTDANGLACATTDPGLMTQVENDARAAFNTTSALPGATVLSNPDLTGLSLVPGLYSFGAAATNLSGTLTLNANGNANATWIFQASSTLITSTSSVVTFANIPAGSTAASMACNVFWTVQSSATLGASSSFVGTVLASASISVLNAATVVGRLLAANAAGAGGAVSLIADTITRPGSCAVLPAGSGGTPVPNGGSPGTPGTPGTPVLTGGPGIPGSPVAPPTGGVPRLAG